MINSKIRITRIRIVNYKGINDTKIEWPDFESLHLPDITIMGSKNGAGKTSILECCAILIAGYYDMLPGHIRPIETEFIGGKHNSASIQGSLSIGKQEHNISIQIHRNGSIIVKEENKESEERLRRSGKIDIGEILGETTEPVKGTKLFYLHGYRKTLEGSMELGAVFNDELEERELRFRPSYMRRYNANFSLFKQMIMRGLMDKADLFEPSSHKQVLNEASLSVLEELLKKYAKVSIDKFRPYSDSSFNLLVRSTKPPKSTFSIDGLSSGQKEIISTIFMIWMTTLNNPSVVIIDEPELHINVEWHKSYISDLLKYAPNNQYILATHSELIMGSVEKEQRLYIER